MTVNTPIFPFPLYILYLFFLFYFFVRKKKIEKYNRKRSNKEYIAHTLDNDNYACLSDVLIVIASPVFVIMFSEQGERARAYGLQKLPVFIDFIFFSCQTKFS
jgi:Ca2+/H+ antiporter